MRPLDPDNIDTIVIHITVSDFGDVATVNQWHKDRGWDGIGYHYLILNCYPTRYRWESKKPDPEADGQICAGRPVQYEGAHVKGHNRHSVGVALIGRKGAFTARQLYSAAKLCRELKERFPNITKIVGHYELFDGKTCPDLDMDWFRELVILGE